MRGNLSYFSEFIALRTLRTLGFKVAAYIVRLQVCGIAVQISHVRSESKLPLSVATGTRYVVKR